MCFGRFRGKQNRTAQTSFGLRVEANPQSSVRRATAPNKWDTWKKMTQNDHARPKKADESQDQETMAPEPVHAGEHIKKMSKHECRMSKETRMLK
jgi:hypothetical protein